jgi:hypothetical protein
LLLLLLPLRLLLLRLLLLIVRAVHACILLSCRRLRRRLCRHR